MHAHTRTRWIAITATCALAVAACSGGDEAAPTTRATTTTSTTTVTSTTDATTTSTSDTTTTGVATTTTTVPVAHGPAIAGVRRVDPFADYRYVAPLDDATPYAGPATPTSLDDVLLVPVQEYLFDPTVMSDATVAELTATIETNGFAVMPGGFRFFHDGYKLSAYEYVPVFVTTDSLYHSWHLAFDKVLRDTEQQRLLPILERFLTGAVDAARAQERDLAGTALADDAHRATAYYESAAVLLGLDVGDVNDLTTAEVELARAAAGIQTSPVSGRRRVRVARFVRRVRRLQPDAATRPLHPYARADPLLPRHVDARPGGLPARPGRRRGARPADGARARRRPGAAERLDRDLRTDGVPGGPGRRHRPAAAGRRRGRGRARLARRPRAPGRCGHGGDRRRGDRRPPGGDRPRARRCARDGRPVHARLVRARPARLAERRRGARAPHERLAARPRRRVRFPAWPARCSSRPRSTSSTTPTSSTP